MTTSKKPMFKYHFRNRWNKPIPGITVDASAKEDVRKLLGWTEEEWSRYTYEAPNDNE